MFGGRRKTMDTPKADQQFAIVENMQEEEKFEFRQQFGAVTRNSDDQAGSVPDAPGMAAPVNVEEVMNKKRQEEQEMLEQANIPAPPMMPAPKANGIPQPPRLSQTGDFVPEPPSIPAPPLDSPKNDKLSDDMWGTNAKEEHKDHIEIEMSENTHSGGGSSNTSPTQMITVTAFNL